MTDKAFQDYYPDNVAHCYGCGRLNEHGYWIKTHWEKDKTVTRYLPEPFPMLARGMQSVPSLPTILSPHFGPL